MNVYEDESNGRALLKAVAEVLEEYAKSDNWACSRCLANGPYHTQIDRDCDEHLRDVFIGSNDGPYLATRFFGWQCSKCQWATTDLTTMLQARWPSGRPGEFDLVCPQCGAEGEFVDYFGLPTS